MDWISRYFNSFEGVYNNLSKYIIIAVLFWIQGFKFVCPSEPKMRVFPETVPPKGTWSVLR
jgi:hypothetical protein